MIPLFYPSLFKKRWLEELARIFSTPWIGQAAQVDKFEREFEKKFGFKYCVAVNSGTSALELAYHLLDIGEDDEVISTVLTCQASNIPILRRKAKIIFCDIEKETLNADPVDIEKKITKKTKAIVVTKLGGVPLNPKIFKIAKNRKIPVVVDACQALGVSEKNGDFVAFSMQAIKHFTCGDSGILVLRNQKKYKRAKLLRWFGINRETKLRSGWQSYKQRKIILDSKEPGYKFHMNDIAATLGLVGLSESDKILLHRKSIADTYARKLDLDIPCITGGSYWLFAILVNNRDSLSRYLFNKGVDTNLVHIRNDLLSVFGGKRQNLPNMNEIENKYLYIPINTKVKIRDAEQIAKLINDFQRKKR